MCIRDRTYAEARTLEATPAPKTLGASEQDVATARGKRSRAPLLIGLLVLVGAAVVILSLRERGPRHARDAARESSGAAEPSHSATSVTAPAPATPVSAAPADPASIELRVRQAPAGAELFLGDRRLGSTDEPLAVPFGREPLTLTLRAPRFKPATIELTPNRNQTVSAPELRPAKAQGSAPKPRKEYENPF